MKKILLSVSVIAVVAAVVIGVTTAFFSDTETSTGNTFTAGSLDLTIDNTCYYNGMACINGHWGGDAKNEPCACTWALSNLDGKVFFNFSDLKPGDTEEDTISLHINDNPAWACAEITLTTNDDMSCTEPELKDDTTCVEGGTLWDGELAQNLEFIWWADDGDNVLEVGEDVHVVNGNLDYLANSEQFPWFGPAADNKILLTLSDSTHNFFKPGTIEPLAAKTEYYIGKAFCFGDLTPEPLAYVQGKDKTPLQGTGIKCDGKLVTNATQSDKFTGDIMFYVEQYRNNPNFKCLENLVRP